MTESAYVRACAVATPFLGNSRVFCVDRIRTNPNTWGELGTKNVTPRPTLAAHRFSYVHFRDPAALTEVGYSSSEGLPGETSTVVPSRSQSRAGASRDGRATHRQRGRSASGLVSGARGGGNHPARARARLAGPPRVDLRNARRFDRGADEARSESLPSLRLVARAAFGGAVSSMQRTAGGAR